MVDNIMDYVESASGSDDLYDVTDKADNEILRHMSGTIMQVADKAGDMFADSGLTKDSLLGFGLGLRAAAMLIEDRSYLDNGIVYFEYDALMSMAYAGKVVNAFKSL